MASQTWKEQHARFCRKGELLFAGHRQASHASLKLMNSPPTSMGDDDGDGGSAGDGDDGDGGSAGDGDGRYKLDGDLFQWRFGLSLMAF